MLDVLYTGTPNGWKVSILAEELIEAGLMKREDVNYILVNLAKGEQFKDDFLRVSPNGRIPALEHHTGSGISQTVFESGACLMYMAETFGGERFFPGPEDKQARYDCLQWLFWQVGGLGPMAGQVSHFVNYAPRVAPDADHSYSLERYQREFRRLLSVMDVKLAKTRFLAGDAYTIADMSSYGWVLPYARFGADLNDFPHLRRWFDEIKARPAVQRGVNLYKGTPDAAAKMTDEQRKTLFAKAKM